MYYPPQNPPLHRQDFSFGQTCSLGREGRWQNLFEGDVTSLPHLSPPRRQEKQQLRQRKGLQRAGELVDNSKCLKKEPGRLVKMETIQEAGEKTLDLG